MPKDPQAAFRTISRGAETWRALAEENSDEPAFRSDLAAILYHIGELLCSGGQFAKGVVYFDQSREILEKLSRDDPRTPEYRADLARSFEQLGRNLPLIGKKDEAEADWRKALVIREKLVAELPDVPQHQLELAFNLEQVATTVLDRDPREAESLLRRDAEVTQRLASGPHRVPIDFLRWATARGRLMYLLKSAGKPNEADDLVRQASDLIQKLERENPSEALWLAASLATIYYVDAATLNDHGQRAQAVAAWNTAIAIHEKTIADPAYPEAAQEQLGHAYRLVGGRDNYLKAAGVFTRLSAAHPGNAMYREFQVDSLRVVSSFLMGESKFAEAEPYLRRAREIQPDSPALHTLQARWLASQNKLTEALVEARLGTLRMPNEYNALEPFLDILNRMGDKKNTLVVLEEQVAAFPKSSAAHYFLAVAFSQQDRHAEAVAEYRSSFKCEPTWDLPRLSLVEELLKSHQTDEALKETRAVYLSPDKGAGSRHWLGSLWARQGQSENALTYLLQAAAMDSENNSVLGSIRDLVNARAGHPDQKALIAKVDQAWADTRFRVTWSAIHGAWADAAAEFEKRVRANPDDHYMWYQAAFALAEQGDVKKYRQHCTEMLARFGDTNDPYIAERVAKACLILPPTPEQLAKTRDLAERSVRFGSKLEEVRYFQFVHALADYRAGQFDAAQKWLDQCLHSEKPLNPSETAMAQLLAAMTEFRLGRKEQARSKWKEASKSCAVLPNLARGQLLNPGDWHDGAALDLLRREAEQVLQPLSQPDSTHALARPTAVKRTVAVP